MNGILERRPRLALATLATLVLAASAATVAPSLDGGFLNWDDDRFVTDNPHVAGLSGENLAWAFGGVRFEAYQPLHLVSYMIDGSLWPMWAPGYRLHSLALYLLAVALVLLLLVRLGVEPIPASLGTLLFALAPFHAESVAWISGRKDVLALALALMSWHAHLASARAVRVRRAGLAALSVVLLAASLLAKSSAFVIVPMIWVAQVVLSGRRPLRSALVLLPHGLLAATAAVAVMFMWSSGDLIREPLVAGLLGRVQLVGWTAWHYLVTAAWPFRLSALYADPGADGLAAGALSAGAVMLALGVWVAIRIRRPRPMPAGPVTAMAWFALGIAPFLNVVPLYYLAADRYLLFPSLGIALGAALAARRILLMVRVDRRMTAGIGFMILAVAWGMARSAECRAFRDSRTLWEQAVEREPEAFFARLKLAETVRTAGEARAAAAQYREALRISPGSRLAVMGLLWSEMLVDRPDLSQEEVHDLLMRFGSAVGNDRAMARFHAMMRERGLDRAAIAVLKHLEGPHR